MALVNDNDDNHGYSDNNSNNNNNNNNVVNTTDIDSQKRFAVDNEYQKSIKYLKR